MINVIGFVGEAVIGLARILILVSQSRIRAVKQERERMDRHFGHGA